MTLKVHLYILIAALLMAGCSETVENKYKSFAEAKKSGAIEKGWIPSVVPSTAENIVERHNLDTNQQILRFNYAPEVRSILLASCEQITPREVNWPKLEANWWPSQLTTGLTTHSEVFFWCEEANVFVASNYQDYAYIWRN